MVGVLIHRDTGRRLLLMLPAAICSKACWSIIRRADFSLILLPASRVYTLGQVRY
jgi:hypothetical protein